MQRSVDRPLNLVALIVSLTLGSCGALLDQEGASAGKLDIRLENATSRAVDERTSQVLQIYGFTLLRQQISPTRIYIETSWRIRGVFKDEMESGAVSAETRLILRGGPIRGSTRGIQSNRSIWLVAENRMLTAEGEIISSGPLSAGFRAYIRGIAAELTAAYHIDSML